MLIFVVVASPAPVRAQLIADGDTNILDNVVTNITGSVNVGTNGSFTLLMVTNGAVVTTTDSTDIALNVGASSNNVVVSGAGSQWICPGWFTIGDRGSFNTLQILDGAYVTNAMGTLGMNSSSRSNLVIVSGTGSRWRTRQDTISVGLEVGNQGSFNQLVVSNGGCVVSGGDSYIGGASSYNSAIVQ